jgi:hypothetical protein
LPDRGSLTNSENSSTPSKIAKSVPNFGEKGAELIASLFPLTNNSKMNMCRTFCDSVDVLMRKSKNLSAPREADSLAATHSADRKETVANQPI